MSISSSSPRSPAGLQAAMPFLVLNLGGEMVYVLQQRLRAQGTEDRRARRVLVDVVLALLRPAFVEELFRPQEAYGARAARVVFDRVVHSSVMRLNKPSMDKLFDLMSTGVKLQALTCPSPRDLLSVTLAHVEGLRSIAGAD